MEIKKIKFSNFLSYGNESGELELNKHSKTLITGVNGFIGSHLAQYLNKNGFSIIGVDINSPDIFKEGKFYKLNLLIKS